MHFQHLLYILFTCMLVQWYAISPLESGGCYSGTWFVRVLGHPCNGDTSNLRVTESQQEGAIWFGQEHVLRLLLVYKTQDSPKHTYLYPYCLLSQVKTASERIVFKAGQIYCFSFFRVIQNSIQFFEIQHKHIRHLKTLNI